MARDPEGVPATKLVGIWIRVSTEDQARGDSPEHHEKRAQYYAEAKGWNVREVYRLEAVSGKSVMEHPETKRMLADIKSGQITGLIFSKLARLARNTKQLLEFSDFFREHEADLVSLEEAIDTSSPAGRLFYTMIAAMAQWEREEIASRVAASVPIRARLGKPLGGRAPLGYQWKDKQLLVDPKEAPLRKLIYELFRTHRRKRAVARILNDQGYRTRTGTRWSDTTIDRILRDPIGKGLRRTNYTKSLGDKKHWELKPESDWVWNDVPPIVPDELWESCNEILSAQRAALRPIARRTVHLFAGLAFCQCGTKMYVLSKTEKYVCTACRNKIPAGDLEAVFAEQLKAIFFAGDELAAFLGQAQAAVSEKEELLRAVATERRRVCDEMDRVYELYISDTISKEGFAERYKPLEVRRDAMDEEIPRLEAERDAMKIQFLSSDAVIADARDLYGRWDKLSPEDKRSIIEAITERITIAKGDITIDLLYLPSPTTPEPPSTPSPSDRDKKATQPQGFAAATNWKSAGNTKVPPARATTTRRSSRTCRSDSSVPRSNSGSSSRNSTPRCASDVSPGRAGVPPPSRPARLAE